MRFLLVIFFLAIVLSSCGDKDNGADELNAEYDLLKSKQKSEEIKVEPQEEPEGSPYKLGIDYDLLKNPYATENAEQVVVYEFFGYTCPHCFYFEPFIDKWLETKPQHVKLQRVPLNFQQGWASLQQAYLTAEVMGITERSHTKLFEAIHNEHKKFNSIDELAEWFSQVLAIDKDEFLSTADSFILDSKQRKADKMGFQMQVTGTPSLVVNGKYKISSKIRNRDEIINIMRHLIEQEAKEMGLISQ